MLKKSERLKRTDFTRFFSLGRRLQHPYFTVMYVPYDSAHASVVVSKKVIRSAVGRNRLRRQLYDILRKIIREPGAEGVYIIVAKPTAATASYASLKEAVTSAVETARRRFSP